MKLKGRDFCWNIKHISIDGIKISLPVIVKCQKMNTSRQQNEVAFCRKKKYTAIDSLSQLINYKERI